MRKPTPITVLTGHLGSGKTTPVNRLLADLQGLRVAAVINDIGGINIGATLISEKGHAFITSDSPAASTNGCICCTL